MTKFSKRTGLSLMVTYSVIKAMKGTIGVECTVNKGTTFKQVFPVLSKTSVRE